MEQFGRSSIATRIIPSPTKCRTWKDLKHALAPMIVVGLLKDYLEVCKVVTLCLRLGQLEYVDLLLKQVDGRNTYLWNTVIRGLEQIHNPWKAINVYDGMLRDHVPLDKFTFPFVLKACASACALKEGEQIHCQILKSPLNLDLFVQGSLIHMYARCGKIKSARASFDAMPHKNLIGWNTMIDGYVKHGNVDAARELFDQMTERDLFSWNTMIDGYTKCGGIQHARQLFDEMPVRDVFSWNIMIDGYAKIGDMKGARELFDQAPSTDVVTWGIIMNGYAKCDQIGIAHNLFEKCPHRNMIIWNSLINGYVKRDNVKEAHKLFDLMPYRNLTSWNVMLDAYARRGEIEIACQLFNTMPIKDVVSWNTVIDGHARLGRMKVARELFDTMPSRDVVSWNVIISGYKQNGQLKEAVELFLSLCLLGEKPDCSTLAMVLSAIADLGLSLQGRWIHAYVDRNKFSLDSIVGVALIDMYSKCGHIDTAMQIFDGIPHKSKDHWNAMITGLAVHGYGSVAVSFFGDMERSMITPDDITFIGVLNACSHAGLVDEGHRYFELMSLKYGITPQIQHYGCMIDLLSRAGQLEVAVDLVNNMPMRANDVVWRALLGASRSHGNIEIAEYAARHLIELVPHDSSSYVLLSNIYGYKGRSESAKAMWKIMKEGGVVKSPGCSSIELGGLVHEFFVGDTSHPEIMAIFRLLNIMTEGLMLEGYVPDVKHSLFDTVI